MAFIPTAEFISGHEQTVTGHEDAGTTAKKLLASKGAGEYLSDDLFAAKKKLIAQGMSPEVATKTVLAAKKVALASKVAATKTVAAKTVQAGK